MQWLNFNVFKPSHPQPLDKSQLGILVVALGAPFFLQGLNYEEMFASKPSRPLELLITAQARLGDKAIKLEVSQNRLSHQTGLTFRPDIQSDRGMLYLTTTSQPLRFSGKNMRFPTDLVFLNGNKVVMTHTQIAPCTDKCPQYGSQLAYDGAIEVKAGVVQALNIQAGTTIEITYAQGVRP
jgi:uncharacterized membrane protein (UPF0127 family)